MIITDLKLYKSKVINNGDTNGGREGYTEVVDAVLQNLFTVVPHEERMAGVTRYRKVFFRCADPDDQAGYNARMMIKRPSNGEDLYALFAATQRDIQADVLGTEKQYASGFLDGAAAISDTHVHVAFEDVLEVDLASADTVWIASMHNDPLDPLADSSGWVIDDSMYNTISGTPSWAGNVATINLVTPLTADFPEGSVLALVIECGTLIGYSGVEGESGLSLGSWTEYSAAGTFDEDNYFHLPSDGAVDDDFTIQILDAALNFAITGANEGLIGSGVVGVDCSPINPGTGQPYMIIDGAGWIGTWAVGDYITVTIHPPSYPVWVKEVVAAAAAVELDDRTMLRLSVG